MAAAGWDHTVLLRSDGAAVVCGDNGRGRGRYDLPAAGAGLAYTAVAAGSGHTVLLRSDGAAVACGDNEDRQCAIPALGAGLSYTAVAAGCYHTVLLRSDGAVVACGSDEDGQCDPPPAAAGGAGLSYTAVAAGACHTVLLRSDGAAVAVGVNCVRNRDGRYVLPAAGAGLTYTAAAAGSDHTVLLKSDGTAFAHRHDNGFGQFPSGKGCGMGKGKGKVQKDVGGNRFGQCDIPPAGAGLSYTAVAAGCDHTVLLRSDGAAVACGLNEHGQCSIPAAGAGLSYTAVAAGMCHTVLLRSDGAAVACGDSWLCGLPAAGAGLAYVAPRAPLPTLVLQAWYDGERVHFARLGGEEFCQIEAASSDSLQNINDDLMSTHLAGMVGLMFAKADVISPGGDLMSDLSATVGRFFEN